MTADRIGVGRLRWRLREIARTLWVRVTAFALLGVGTALLGWALRDRIPERLAGQIGAEAIDPILTILASSLLTITTFSLSILTAAYATASSGSTPRAVSLLVRDGVSQTVLATFMGAFVFSLVGLIMLNTQLYGEDGRVVLFVVTLMVILVVILSLLRWINRLGELGLIGDNLGRVEDATVRALTIRLESPWMGANPLEGPPPPDAHEVLSPEVGHVQNCDMRTLSQLAETHGLIVYVAAGPGQFVHPARPLMHVTGLPEDAEEARDISASLADCLSVRPQRSFDQDPRFGFLVLSEIGQRALSAAVNDPGTAVAVIERTLRILSVWTEEARPQVEFPRLHIRSITAQEILSDALLPLAREGSDIFQVHDSLLTCLLALTRMAPRVYGPAAAELAARLWERFDQRSVYKHELEYLQGLHRTIAAG